VNKKKLQTIQNRKSNIMKARERGGRSEKLNKRMNGNIMKTYPLTQLWERMQSAKHKKKRRKREWRK
jgi:hypothetical protein